MRIALLTTGLRPAALGFHGLPGEPVGIVDWDARAAPGWRDRLDAPLARPVVAALRGRRHASLAHLCAARGLAHARLDKTDAAALARTLADWRADLVITSGCAMVPMAALADLSAGAINLHPSPLPAWRGAEPLLWQLASGRDRIGASVHRLAAGSDTGPVLGRADMVRPDGLGRRALSDAVDGRIGVPLLADVVRALIEAPDLPGEAQPAASPTPYARRVPRRDLARAVPLDALDARTVWNLARYAGDCPADWLGATGRRARLRWRAASFAPGAGGGERASSGPWLDLVRPDGRVRLVPIGLERARPPPGTS